MALPTCHCCHHYLPLPPIDYIEAKISFLIELMYKTWIEHYYTCISAFYSKLIFYLDWSNARTDDQLMYLPYTCTFMVHTLPRDWLMYLHMYIYCQNWIYPVLSTHPPNFHLRVPIIWIINLGSSHTSSDNKTLLTKEETDDDDS